MSTNDGMNWEKRNSLNTHTKHLDGERGTSGPDSNTITTRGDAIFLDMKAETVNQNDSEKKKASMATHNMVETPLLDAFT